MKLGNRKLSDMIAPGQDVTAWAEEIEDLEGQRDRLAQVVHDALYGQLDQHNALALLKEVTKSVPAQSHGTVRVKVLRDLGGHAQLSLVETGNGTRVWLAASDIERGEVGK